MRWLIIAFLFLILLGCNSLTQKQEKDFNVSLLDASHEEIFDEEQNTSFDKISFILQNNEPFPLDCDVILDLDNRTDTTSKKGVVGTIQQGTKKNVSISFEMLFGKSNLRIVPDCRMP